jgi:catechol 2,3-dioxygenase-like lactoylglutathione lyase family enzyme
MLDHIGLNVSDYASARDFYTAALAPLGLHLAMEPAPNVGGFSGGDPQRGFPLWIYQREGDPTTGHVALTAPDRATVDAFHAAALAAGAADNGAPGVREIYHPNYYGAYVLTADGVNLEAVSHRPPSARSR